MPTFKNRILGANPDSTERSLDSDILVGCLLDAIGYCRAMFPEQIFKRASRNNYHHLSRNEIGGAKRISRQLFVIVAAKWKSSRWLRSERQAVICW